MTTDQPVTPVRKRAPAARGGRFLAAGAAVGVSFAAVGAMAAAAQLADGAPDPAAPVQQLVIPTNAPVPQQIVIVIPQPGSDPIAVAEAASNRAAPELPPRPEHSTSTPAAKAQTESGGS